MGRFIDQENGFAIYNAPKGGGTTIRSWIYFAKTGELAIQNEGGGYLNQKPKTYKQLKNIGYEVCNFIPWALGPSICIVRNPVDRFISAYKDKIIREKKCGNPPPSLSEFIDDFERLITTNDHQHGANPNLRYLEHHFAPQTLIFGENKDYFQHIFMMHEISTNLKSYLEKQWGVELPNIHCRKVQKNKTIVPSQGDRKRIEEIYKADFSCEWIANAS